MNFCKLKYFAYLLCFILIISCSSTRRLEKGQTLYIGSKLIVKKKKTDEKFEIKQFGKKTSDAYLAVWDLPNGALFGTPFFKLIPIRLYTYNLFYTKKTHGFRYWMKENFGEEPVLLDDIKPEIKLKNLIKKYEGYGHFGTTGSYELKYKKRGKKCFVNYKLEVTPAYCYRNILFELESNQNHISELINLYKQKAILKPGAEFNLDSISNERKSLTKKLRDNGFFYLNDEDIIIEADTNIGNRQVDVKIKINSNLSNYQLNKVVIDSVELEIDSTLQNTKSKYYYYYEGRLKKKFTDSLLFIKKGNIYSSKKSSQTSSLFNSLSIFSGVYVQHYVNKTDSSRIISRVTLFPAKATNLSALINANYKASGYVGPSLNVKLNQNNVFGSAENLHSELDVYYDFPIGINKSKISKSTGLSFRNTLKSPLVIGRNKFYKSGTLPFHFISLNGEYNNKVEYFNLYSLNLLFGLSWQSKHNIRHRVDVLNATYSTILNTTSLFDTIVKKDPFLRNSLVDQLIFGSHYVFTIDRRTKSILATGFYYQSQIELAGNLASGLSSIINSNSDEIKTILNAPVAQFVQFNYDIRYAFNVGKIGVMAFRHLGGIGIPYGNSKRMPYIRQYYSGGTASLRPFTARTIGPGRYIEKERAEVNQVGDVKLEINFEYRFKLGVRFNGAFWSDAGNIWLFNEDPTRPGSGIRWNKLIEDSYLTSGLGIRLDLNYILLRFDMGTVIYSPANLKNENWIWQSPTFIIGSVIGIGYPF